MTSVTDDSSEIKETDIIFDCPNCGKSLAIDYRGAGLTIPCSDCGEKCTVPIPEGMQLSDIDSSEEEQEIRILNLRRALSAAQFRIQHLEAEIEELSARRDSLEKTRADQLYKFGSIQEKVGGIQKAIEELSKAIAEIGKNGAAKPPSPRS